MKASEVMCTSICAWSYDKIQAQGLVDVNGNGWLRQKEKGVKWRGTHSLEAL
jgi:hypothetical protein